jgi:hypothetical protein
VQMQAGEALPEAIQRADLALAEASQIPPHRATPAEAAAAGAPKACPPRRPLGLTPR